MTIESKQRTATLPRNAERFQFWRYSSRNRSGHVIHPLTMVRRNLILDLWAAGSTKDAIAFAISVDLDTVSKHLRAARKAGDVRAVVRHPATLHAMEAAK